VQVAGSERDASHLDAVHGTAVLKAEVPNQNRQ